MELYGGDSDGPMTCPKCGARTEFEEREDGYQDHTCLNPECGFTFIGDPSED